MKIAGEQAVLFLGGAALVVGAYWLYTSVASASEEKSDDGSKLPPGPRSPEELAKIKQSYYTTARVQDMLKTFADLAVAYPEVEQSYRLLDPGPVDGKWKKQTWDAVVQFQGIRLIPQTGEVDLTTCKELDAVTPRYNAAKAQLAPSTKVVLTS